MLSRANPISYLRFGEHTCGSSRLIHHFRHFFLHLGSQPVCYTINVPDGYSTFLCCLSCHQQASHLHGTTISYSCRRSSLQLATWTTWQTGCSGYLRYLCHTYVLASSVVSILSPNLISITLLTPVLFYIISLFSLLYKCQLCILTFRFIPVIHS